jgi:hypothetical protein
MKYHQIGYSDSQKSRNYIPHDRSPIFFSISYYVKLFLRHLPLSLPWALSLTIECENNKISHVFNMSLDRIILPLCIRHNESCRRFNTSVPTRVHVESPAVLSCGFTTVLVPFPCNSCKIEHITIQQVLVNCYLVVKKRQFTIIYR